MNASKQTRGSDVPAIGITGGISTGKITFWQCLRVPSDSTFAPRVLVAAPRRDEFDLETKSWALTDNLSAEQVRDREGAIASTRGACAPRN